MAIKRKGVIAVLVGLPLVLHGYQLNDDHRDSLRQDLGLSITENIQHQTDRVVTRPSIQAGSIKYELLQPKTTLSTTNLEPNHAAHSPTKAPPLTVLF